MMKYQKPLVIGVAGGTASGKTTVADKILEGIGAEQVAYFPHDVYYRDNPHMSFEERVQVNYDHPESLETELLIEQVKTLIGGQSVERPTYNFSTHRRGAETVAVTPSPIILVEGILIFAEPELRKLLDIKVFVDSAPDVRFIRRLRRDVADRGREMESIVVQYLQTVRPMHLQFVEPSKRYADVIIPRGGRNKIALDMVVARLRNLLD